MSSKFYQATVVSKKSSSSSCAAEKTNEQQQHRTMSSKSYQKAAISRQSSSSKQEKVRQQLAISYHTLQEMNTNLKTIEQNKQEELSAISTIIVTAVNLIFKTFVMFFLLTNDLERISDDFQSCFIDIKLFLYTHVLVFRTVVAS